MVITVLTGCQNVAFDAASPDIEVAFKTQGTEEAGNSAASGLAWDELQMDVGGLKLPDYSGTDFYIVNDNAPFFTDNLMGYDGSNFIYLSELDELGRCGTCIGLFTNASLPTEEREGIGHVKPTGWQTVKYDKSVIPDLYLYNRCHLLMYAVSGINDDVRNLITGTRQFNLSMLEIENQIYDLLKNDKDVRLLYRVTPWFEGDNLVAKGVLMEAAALGAEDALKLCIFIYNVQDGIVIDYATGESGLAQEATAAEADVLYVANTNTKKFHYPDCSSAKQIAPGNRWDYAGNREELINMGYEPCKICRP